MISNEEKFSNLFLLICNLIDNLGMYDKNKIEQVLKMLNEYDFEKNREQ